MVLKLVHQVRKKSLTKRWGVRKVHELIQEDLKGFSIQIGRDKLFDLLRENNMLVQKRKRRFFTTQSHHWLRKYDNIVENLVIARVNQVWVSDITYVKIGNKVYYLYLITDVYSQKIVGWNLSLDLKAKSALKALQKALAINKNIPAYSLIHHSDRGIQYCSTDYTKLLSGKKIMISMTNPGSPQENAIAERINGILKEEWLKEIEEINFESPEPYVKKIIQIYNQYRPHNSLSNLTPEKVHSKGFFRHNAERVIGKEYKAKKTTLEKEQSFNHNYAIGPDYSLPSCSSAELDSASSWYCKFNNSN